MAYQNVGTPRFYIDLPTYLRSINVNVAETIDGGEKLQGNMFGLDNFISPSFKQTDLAAPEDVDIIFDAKTDIYKATNMNKSYFAFLNVRGTADDWSYINQFKVFYDHQISNSQENIEEIINLLIPVYDAWILKNGFSIATFDWNEPPDLSDINDPHLFKVLNFQGGYFGNISFGSYYDMPVNCDLNLKMSVEYDGSKSSQSIGGATILNTIYNGAPWWYNTDGNKVEPWAIGESSGKQKRNGRKMWNLNFSYMTDSDLFASNYMNSKFLTGTKDQNVDLGYSSDDIESLVTEYEAETIEVEGGEWTQTWTEETTSFAKTIGNDNSFHAQVLNKINMGQKFIFQPNNNSNNPSDFFICVLDQDSFSVKQTAHNVYNIEMTIKEVW